MVDPVVVVILLVLSFLFWAFLHGASCALNGGEFWRCLGDDIMWFLPGGNKRKADYIRDRMDGFDDGCIGEYNYRDIREYDLYEEVGKACLPGRISFIINHILIPFGPTAVYVAIKYWQNS